MANKGAQGPLGATDSGMRPGSFPIGSRKSRAAAAKKLKLDVQIEADSFRVLTSLVEEGLGYTLLPPSSVRNEVADGRLETSVIAKPAPMRELAITQLGPTFTPAAR